MTGRDITESLLEMLEPDDRGENEFDKMIAHCKKRRYKKLLINDYKIARQVSEIELRTQMPVWAWVMKIQSPETFRNLLCYLMGK